VVIFGTVVAFASFLYGITMVGPLMGSVLGLVEPVVAAVASVVLLKQFFTVTDIVGIASILGGVAILSVYKGSNS
jgi:drug/metabolite transporter (DMT)-like permease